MRWLPGPLLLPLLALQAAPFPLAAGDAHRGLSETDASWEHLDDSCGRLDPPEAEECARRSPAMLQLSTMPLTAIGTSEQAPVAEGKEPAPVLAIGQEPPCLIHCGFRAGATERNLTNLLHRARRDLAPSLLAAFRSQARVLAGSTFSILLVAIVVTVLAASSLACFKYSRSPAVRRPEPSGARPSVRPSVLPPRDWVKAEEPRRSATPGLHTPRQQPPHVRPAVPRLNLERREQQQSLLPIPPGEAPMGRLSQLGSARSPRFPLEHGGLRLAPELVVPSDHECSLLIRRLSAQNFGTRDTATIDDAKGFPVFAATFLLSPSHEHARQGGRRLTLRSAVDEVVYGYCCDEASGTAMAGLQIFDADHQRFGVLRPDSQDYICGYSIYAATGGAGLQLRGDMRYGNMNALDGEGRLLAVSEAVPGSGSQTRKVRIGPGVDAGLVSVAILGMDLLQHDRHANEGKGSILTSARAMPSVREPVRPPEAP